MRTHHKINVLGVMSGTSCDGLDVTHIQFTQNSWKILKLYSFAFPAQLKKRVLDFQGNKKKITLKDLLTLDRDLGLWFAKEIKKITKKNKIDLIAHHGQTVAHHPKEKGGGLTLQIGNPFIICEQTGITVCSQFRNGDIASGGQGAPLVPLFHYLISKKENLGQGGIAFHNIGGISNLTYISPKNKIMAFDTGPGNIWIDASVQKMTKGKMNFDQGGAISRSGSACLKTVRKILLLPFFSLKPPKSCGRNDFPFELLTKNYKGTIKNLPATATHITAYSIVNSYKKWILNKNPLMTIIFCGGGAYNKHLIQTISSQIPAVKIKTMREIDIDEKSVESAAFGFLGFISLYGLHFTGDWTGAKHFSPPSQILPGKNWKDLEIKKNAISIEFFAKKHSLSKIFKI